MIGRIGRQNSDNGNGLKKLWSRRGFTALAFSVAAGAMMTPSSIAQAEDADLSGKTVNVLVGFGAGGTYDSYARLVADHLSRFLPGEPNMIVENMPGGGGMRSMAFLATAAPKDGTVVTILSNTSVLRSAIGKLPEGLSINDIPLIGRVASPASVTLTWNTSPVKTIEDATKNDITIAATGRTSTTSIVPRTLNAIAGTKFEVVEGYKGTAAGMLALERGEVGAAGSTMESLASGHPDWLKDDTVNILVQNFMERHPLYPDVPALGEFATDDKGVGLAKLAASTGEFGRVFALPPGTPEEVVVAYRKAFETMVQDADFLADAKKRNLTLDPAGGAEVGEDVEVLLDIPADALEAFKVILDPDA